MSHPNSPLYALVTVVVFFALYFIRSIVVKKLGPHRLSLPPGPKGIPFLGSALEINKSKPWLTYEAWKKTYGEIVSCNLFGQTFIIINSERVAKALLDQRSNIYSGRPVLQTSVLFGIGFNTAHLPYASDAWKAHRKIFHRSLNNSVIHKYHEALTEQTRILLEKLLQTPEDYDNIMGTHSASIIMSITYGYKVLPKNDPFATPMEEMIKIIILTTPERAALLNLFPQLLHVPTWLPGTELQRLAKRCKELSPKVRELPFQFVKECLSKGVENDSMVAQLLKNETAEVKDRESYEQNIKDSAVTSFIAGTDTTQSTLTTLIMALILNPEVQDRAQAIIDEVVGRDRLPTFNDRESLQYIEALVMETSRWGSLVPMCIPHMTTEDDIFEQCLIPKGSIVIPNQWGMSRDEERFPDPTAFKPERHLDADGNLRSEDISSLWFGYGRRVCSGRYLANASLWLAATNMLSVFRFSKAIGPAGYEIDVFPKFEGAVSLRPVPFPCRITPRFEGAEELVV